MKFLIGYDGSEPPRAAVLAVARRSWTAWMTRIMAVSDAELSKALPTMIEPGRCGEAIPAAKAAQDAAESLSAAGISVTADVREDDPRKVLISEARQWKADCIFS